MEFNELGIYVGGLALYVAVLSQGVGIPSCSSLSFVCSRIIQEGQGCDSPTSLERAKFSTDFQVGNESFPLRDISLNVGSIVAQVIGFGVQLSLVNLLNSEIHFIVVREDSQ